MRLEDLERYLERGDQLGFKTHTGTEEYLGWILLSKQKPHERALSLLEPGEEPEFIARQEMIRKNPYQVWVVELSRAAHESEGYETNEDYRLNQNHYFPSLDAVECFVRTYGHTLSEIKWPIEIDFP